MTSGYVPEAGDIVWLHFDPQAGHEQAGHRPALVLSPRGYNAMRGMLVACPMSSRIKDYPFEVIVAREPPSVALADQVKCLDWRARRASHKGQVSVAVLDEVRSKLGALLGI